MEYTTTWPLMQPIPILNPNPNPPPFSSSHYSYYPSLPQRPTTQSSLHPELIYTNTDPTTSLRPPGVDSYTSLSSSAYPQAEATPAYYLDPNSQNWAAREAVRQYGSDPAAYAPGAAVGAPVPANGTEHLAIAHPGSTIWTNVTVQPHGNVFWKKRQKKTKLVQSAYCEVCKVDCNSKDVLDQHKLGKRHRKNLEKLKEAAATCSASAESSNPVIGLQENPRKGKTSHSQKGKKKAVEPLEDLESKRRKVVKGGAAAEAVKTCAICNVVCNSETVFQHHLAGQKHANMLKKHAAGREVATAT